MKEQALKIVSQLIDQHKITGQEAVILIQSIVMSSCNYSVPIVVDSIKPEPAECGGIQPHGINTTDILKTPWGGPEVIYSTDQTSTTNKGQEIIYG